MLAAAGEKSFGILVPNEGLSEDRRKLMRSRAVAQPFGTYTQLLRLRGCADRRVAYVSKADEESI
jgi:hypothetical protein